MRSSWIIQVGLKPNDKCPENKRRRQNWRRHREEGDVEAEIGRMWPQMRSTRKHQKVKRQGRDPAWSLHRSPADIFISSFWPEL